MNAWTLAQPKMLLLVLIPFSFLFYFLIAKRRSSSPLLLRFSIPNEGLRTFIRKSKASQRLLFTLGIGGLMLLSYAAARPTEMLQWTRRWTEGIDICIVLDVSESMEANDLTPTRILAAKQVIHDFINRRASDRIGLVIFGGEAVTKSPLTRDYDFLRAQVDDIRLRELKQGTAIGMGLANGISRLRKSDSKNKVMVLLTDGDSNVGAINPITAANLAKQEGIRVYTIGIGRDLRVVVPIYAYDMWGKKTQIIAQVPSYINPDLLREISTTTGGKFYMARDNNMLNRILQEIDKLERSKIKSQAMQKREERFFWPAVIGIVFLASLTLLQETRFRKARLKHAVSV